jgi:hypothetical protein
MLKAIKNWVGMEGTVKRGETFQPITEGRGQELIESGRAVEVKGTPNPEVQGETKEQPKKRRTRKTKPQIETKEG